MADEIAIVAPGGWRLDEIRTLLKSNRMRPIEFHSLSQIETGLLNRRFSSLLLRLECFSPTTVQHVGRLRSAFPEVGLVTIAKDIDPNARYASRNIARHILLDDTLELGDLVEAINKLRLTPTGMGEKARLHPRTERRGEVRIVVQRDGRTLSGSFVDFAQMGARVRLGSTEAFQNREIVQVEYRSSHDPLRVHRLVANAVWARKEKNATLMGLRFVAAL